MRQVYIHPTAEVSEGATLGEGTRVWHHVHVREGATVGRNCTLGQGVYVDSNVSIGNNVKIQNNCSVYHGVTVEDGVFLGPGVILTNDKLPRAINPDGTLKTDGSWTVGKILVKRGASLGAGAVILPGVVIGEFALVAAGAVVTSDVPAHGLVVGVPARLRGFVCRCGNPLKEGEVVGGEQEGWCPQCEEATMVQPALWR